jgi:hypothetical protein
MKSVMRVRLIGMRRTACVIACAGAAAQLRPPRAAETPDRVDWKKVFEESKPTSNRKSQTGASSTRVSGPTLCPLRTIEESH